MSTARAQEIALIEAAFRIANDRMARWEERHTDERVELYLCECASQPCRQRIPLKREEYEAVRAGVLRFVVVPGHVIPELETVVETYPSYQVIEKPAALMDLLIETDTRNRRTGAAADAADALADTISSDDA